MAADTNQTEELKVFIPNRESTCGECGENLGSKAWIALARDKGALCLACADLDHLVFLPSGDAALTRRASKHSTLSPIVLRWSRARKRYERQGLLVEAEALEKAEAECLADGEARARRMKREAEGRQELDHDYIERFAERVRALFPTCPAGREHEIAEHACRKYSGRVGRSASAKGLHEEAVRLAVIAHVRHRETKYDVLLAKGHEKREARAAVEAEVYRVMKAWEAES
jgi:hypothetical protein